MDAKEEVKRLLADYVYIMPSVHELNTKINEIMCIMAMYPDTVRAAVLKDVVISPTNEISDPTYQLLKRYLDDRQEYVNKINELLDKKKLIETMLFKLKPLEKRIIELRYIDNPSYRCDIWEWIGDKTNYSRIQVIRIYDNSLERMAKWYKT